MSFWKRVLKVLSMPMMLWRSIKAERDYDEIFRSTLSELELRRQAGVYNDTQKKIYKTEVLALKHKLAARCHAIDEAERLRHLTGRYPTQQG